jgi:hypothetical protein
VNRSTDVLACWGDNSYGELAQAPNSPQINPIARDVPGNWDAVAVGGHFFTCGIATTGALSCWGFGADGQLGAGNNGSAQVPQAVTIAGAPPIDEITAGERHTCARSGTRVWCWGGNRSGQLGDQTAIDRSSPTPVPGSWTDIAAGQLHTCGIRTGGTLWCWGQNALGQLGDGTFVERHEPTQVGTATDWITVTGGQAHTCALSTSGALWCWGSNLGGELGDGTAWRAELVLVDQ